MTSAEPLRSLLKSYQRDLRAANKADHTLRLYSETVEFMARWLEAQDVPATLQEFTRLSIRGWLGELAQTRAPGTVLTRFQGLRRFSRWLVAEGFLEVSPMEGMEQPDAPAKPVPVLSDAALSALLKACSGRSFEDRRDEVIVRLLMDCGLRSAELCSIKVADLDLDEGSGTVTGKGNRTRHIYLSAKTVRAIDRYLRERNKHRFRDSPQLILGQKGPLQAGGLKHRLRYLAKEAGLAQHIHPHMFRHTWAHDHMMSGGQERDLKRLAGWRSDKMLERYGASAADARAREAVKRMRRGDRV